MSKYLVILTGSPRGGVKTWKTLFDLIINPLNADLAICFGDSFINKENSYLVSKAKFDWTFEEPKNWKNYFEKHYSVNAIDFLLKGSEYGMAGGLDSNTGSGGIVSAVKDIIYRNHMETLFKYDYIIHTRADQYYVDSLPIFDKDDILIPQGEDYFGICDRFILLHKSYAEKYFSLCKFLEHSEEKGLIPNIVSPESTLLGHLKNEKLYKNIKRIKRINFTVTKKNEHTRWRVAKYHLYFKSLMIKYPDEFVDSMENLKNKVGIIYFIIKNPVLCFNFYYILFRRYIGNVKKLLLK